MLSAFTLLLLGAGLGIHLEDSSGMPQAEAQAIMESIGDAIEARTSTAPILDDVVWSGCDTKDRCLPAIRARTHAEEIVLLRMIGGIRNIHVIAERFDDRLPAPRQTSVNLPKETEKRTQALAQIAADLFPNVTKIKPPPIVPPIQPIVEEPSLAPWLFFGGSAVALGVGVAFGLSSKSARNTLEGELNDASRYNTLSDRQETHGTAANILFGTAIAAAITGSVWYVVDSL